jgi:SAM-dependent methyltransferase
MTDIWNHNIEYQPVLLAAVPPGCGSALDVGCGQGFLLPELAARAERVVGIDRDEPSLLEASERTQALTNVSLVAGDALTYDFGQRFDAVLSVAVLHHLDLELGLERLRELTAPGGVLGLVGLARSTRARDWAVDGVGAVETRIRRVRTPHTMVTAPVCDPRETYAEVEAAAHRVLPGVRYRRHTLFRYSLLWTKPA